MSMIRNYHNYKPQKNPWHREEEPQNNHKTPGRQSTISSLFPIEMIAKLEWTQKKAQQNIDQLQNPTWEKQSTMNEDILEMILNLYFMKFQLDSRMFEEYCLYKFVYIPIPFCCFCKKALMKECLFSHSPSIQDPSKCTYFR